MKVLILDAEIKKAIQGRGETRTSGIEYCEGWRDFANMGLACLGGWQSWDSKFRVWGEGTQGQVEAQQAINKADKIITFNGLGFDGPLLRAHDIEIPDDKHVDLLVKIWEAHGLGPKFVYPSHAGFGLDNCALSNNLPGKTGHGGHAPIQWQQGKYCEVVDYCLHDVWITLQLVKLCLDGLFLSPKDRQHCAVHLGFGQM